MSSSVLIKLIKENEWVDIPSKITTREGHAIDTSSNQWHLPLQCSADCKDYVWVKNDEGRVDDLKRQYSMTVIARETAEKKSKERNAKKSVTIHHNPPLRVGLW